MFDAVFKALGQMFSPPFRAILVKAASLAIVLLIVLIVVLFRLLHWLSDNGLGWLEHVTGPAAHGPVAVLGIIVAIGLGLGLVAGAALLVPAATALVASFFADDIALGVELSYYPDDPPGVALSLWQATAQGTKTALLALAVYLFTLPFLFFAGFGIVIYFIAMAWLLGREYFAFAAMRFRPAEEAQAMRQRYAGTVFAAGLFIAGFVLIPIVNLATPLFGTALMVHMHKRLSARARSRTLPAS
jgi:CysZ protein